MISNKPAWLPLTALLLLFPFLVSFQLFSPDYRPDANWQVIEAERFKVIFPEDSETSARRALKSMEGQYDQIRELVGGELEQLPVILNDYTDQPGGFVVGIPLRMEATLAPNRGKLFNPSSGGWLEEVMPHEVVHALHVTNTPDHLVGRAFEAFSDDMATVFHGSNPVGLLEGIAVYQEGLLLPGLSGRPNQPFFYNQIQANLASEEERWSIGEMITHAPYNQPRFSRPYLGGYAFTEFLHEEFGEDVTRKLIEHASNYFFLSYGAWLKSVTGKSAGELEEMYYQYRQTQLEKRLDSIAERGISDYQTLETPFEGPFLRRPAFRNEDELIYFGRFYNQDFGLYLHDRNENEANPFFTGFVTENYQYSIKNSDSIVFSRSFVHPFYDNYREMDLSVADPDKGSSKRLTENQRLHDPQPIEGDNRKRALQNHRETSQWVEVVNDTVQDTLLSIYPHNITEIAAHPDNDSFSAVLANINGATGIWVVNSEEVDFDKSSPDLALKNGAIYDISWHPDGEKMLFSADLNGVMNVYEWHLEEDKVYQLTNVKFNAFEPSYHPSGDSIAFVLQRPRTREVAILGRDDFLMRELGNPERRSNLRGFVQHSHWTPEFQREIADLPSAPYSMGYDWLKPNVLLPDLVFNETFPFNRYGGRFIAMNALTDRSYELGLSYGANQLWFDGSLHFRSFYPGLDIEVFSAPLAREERGLMEQGLSVTFDFPWEFEQNFRSSNLSLRPGLKASRFRGVHSEEEGFFEEKGPWNMQYRSSLKMEGAFRIKQNIRDVQPNSGLRFYGKGFGGFTEDIGSRPDWALSGGIHGFTAPLGRWNQSLRVGLEAQYTDGILLGQEGLLEPGFSTGIKGNEVFSFNTRYTIPLFYPDQAWTLIPGQFNVLYAAFFSNTIGPFPDEMTTSALSESRTVIGAELRSEVGFFYRIPLDIGVRVGYEPGREEFRWSFVF